MREKVLFLTTVFLLAGIIYWLAPDQGETVVVGVGKGAYKRVEAKRAVAAVPVVVVAAPPEKTFVKPVGSHQGLPISPLRQMHVAGNSSSDVKSNSPFARFAKMKMGPAVEISGRSRRAVGARAVPENEKVAGEFSVLGHTIVATDGEFQNLAFNKNAKPVVVDAASGKLGIVTGTLIVKMSDSGAADRLAGQESLTMLRYDQATNLAYFRVPDGYEIAPGAVRISKAAGVARVEIEILENYKATR